MSTTASATGSAGGQSAPWSSRARDWASVEDDQVPTYEEALRRAGAQPGWRVIDVGCGSGKFLETAAARGLEVSGLDASEALLEIARARVPGADLHQGDMQSLPFADSSFDLVTGFNSFFFAADIVGALREAGRVAKPAAPVVIQVWGRPDHCDLTAMKHAVFGPPDPATQRVRELCEPGVLEEIAAHAGLTPVEAFDLSWAYEYPGEDAMVRALLSPGPVAIAVAERGEQAVRDALVEGLEPYRTPEGGYRLRNEWHYLIARA